MRKVNILLPLVMVLTVLQSGCILESRESQPGEPQDPTPESEASPCEKEYQEIRAKFRSFPKTYRGASEEVIRDVDRVRIRAKDLLEKCSAPGAWRADTEYMLSYLLSASFYRYVASAGMDPVELSSAGIDVVRSALKSANPGSTRETECLSVLGFLLNQRAQYQRDPAARGRDFAELREVYEKLLPSRTEWQDRLHTVTGIAQSYVGEDRYEKARKYLEKAREEDHRLREAYACDRTYFEILEACGDLEAMEDLVHRRLIDYPDRVRDSRIPVEERAQMAVWVDQAEFWIGRIRLAMGDIDGAKNAFQIHISQLDEKEARLAEVGRSLNNVTRIYRDFRSRVLLRFIEESLGKKPDLDLDFGELWCTPDRPTLATSRGKVVVVLFRQPRDPRSERFLTLLYKFVKSERRKDLVFLLAAYQFGELSPAKQAQTMLAELKSLGLQIPAGLDPNHPVPKILHSLTPTVGSASIVIFDRGGRFAWYLNDPQYSDAGLTRTVIRRILAESGSGK